MSSSYLSQGAAGSILRADWSSWAILSVTLYWGPGCHGRLHQETIPEEQTITYIRRVSDGNIISFCRYSDPMWPDHRNAAAGVWQGFILQWNNGATKLKDFHHILKAVCPTDLYKHSFSPTIYFHSFTCNSHNVGQKLLTSGGFTNLWEAHAKRLTQFVQFNGNGTKC